MGTHSLENPSSFQIPAQPTVSSAPGVVGLLLTPVSSQLVHQLCPLLLGSFGFAADSLGDKRSRLWIETRSRFTTRFPGWKTLVKLHAR